MATSKNSRRKVGVIGLGIIGTRVAANLRSAGHQVYVWSRTPRAAPNFLGSVVEVADLCDVIQLFVSDNGALEEIIRTVAAALRPRHVVLCHSTVSPDATRRAAGIVESQGARYLDAPFTGSKSAAQNKQLVYYIGGAKPALEEVRPVLEATSKAILHVGGVGDASVLKIATNMLTASTVQTLAEALALVRAAGIDASKLVEALENNASRSGTSDLKLPAMIAANTEPNFSLKHMLKDVRFAQQLADKYELSLPLTDTTADVLELGMQNEWGDEDFSVVAQLYPTPAAPAPAPAPVPVAPMVPKTDDKPAETAAKPSAEAAAEPKSLPKELPAGVVLPPRPGTDAKSEAKIQAPAPTEAVAKPEVKTSAPGPTEPAVKSAPVEKEGKPVAEDVPKKPVAESAAGPVPSARADAMPPAADSPFVSSPNAATDPKPDAKPPDAGPSGAPVPNADPDTKREKKSKFQLIRGLFKPASTEGR